MDVMLTLASNRPLQDGAAPDRNRIRTEFPYFGEPYSRKNRRMSYHGAQKPANDACTKRER